MLSKDLLDVKERLFPMYKDALNRLSFRLEIMTVEWFVSVQATNVGTLPVYGVIYSCRGALLGTGNYIAHVTGMSDPYATQETIDEIIQSGCDNLRESFVQQGSIVNGKG